MRRGGDVQMSENTGRMLPKRLPEESGRARVSTFQHNWSGIGPSIGLGENIPIQFQETRRVTYQATEIRALGIFRKVPDREPKDAKPIEAAMLPPLELSCFPSGLPLSTTRPLLTEVRNSLCGTPDYS